MSNLRDKKLYRIKDQAKIAGVCAGLAEYFEIDVTLVRLLFAASLLVGGFGFVIYIMAAFILPDKKDLDLDPK